MNVYNQRKRKCANVGNFILASSFLLYINAANVYFELTIHLTNWLTNNTILFIFGYNIELANCVYKQKRRNWCCIRIYWILLLNRYFYLIVRSKCILSITIQFYYKRNGLCIGIFAYSVDHAIAILNTMQKYHIYILVYGYMQKRIARKIKHNR